MNSIYYFVTEWFISYLYTFFKPLLHSIRFWRKKIFQNNRFFPSITEILVNPGLICGLVLLVCQFNQKIQLYIESGNQLHLVRDCWSEDPHSRPKIDQIRSLMKSLHNGRLAFSGFLIITKFHQKVWNCTHSEVSKYIMILPTRSPRFVLLVLKAFWCGGQLKPSWLKASQCNVRIAYLFN